MQHVVRAEVAVSGLDSSSHLLRQEVIDDHETHLAAVAPWQGLQPVAPNQGGACTEMFTVSGFWRVPPPFHGFVQGKSPKQT